jgi:RNA polymerase sigma-70 factor (ECF subfamily)
MADDSENARRVRFEATVTPLARALYATALRLVRQPADAHDVVQETYLRAYRTFDAFVPGTKAKAWLFTILYSVFINRHRRDRRTPRHMPLDDVEESFQEALADPRSAEMLTGGRNARDDLSDRVAAALDALPDDFRSVVLLVDVEELSYEEAAAALRCPVGTVRSRLSRARKQLFVALRDEAGRAGPSSTSSGGRAC